MKKKYIFILLSLILISKFNCFGLLSTISQGYSIHSGKKFLFKGVERLKKDFKSRAPLSWENTFASMERKYRDYRFYSLEKKRELIIKDYFDNDVEKYTEVEDLLIKRIEYFIPLIHIKDIRRSVLNITETVSYLAMGMSSLKVKSFLEKKLTEKNPYSNSEDYLMYKYTHIYFKFCLYGLGLTNYKEEIYKYLQEEKLTAYLHDYFIYFAYASGNEPFEARDYALSLLKNKRQELLKNVYVLRACLDIILNTDKDITFIENFLLDKDVSSIKVIVTTILNFIGKYREKITNEAVIAKLYKLSLSKEKTDKYLKSRATFILLSTSTKDKAWLEVEARNAKDPERKKRLESFLHPGLWRPGYSFGPKVKSYNERED